MSSKTVKTEAELKKAIDAGIDEIIITDKELVKKIHKVKQIKNVSAAAIGVAVALIVAALATAPATGGLSLAFAAPVAAATGLSTGAIIAITGIITLGAVSIIAICSGYEEIDFSLKPPRLKLKKKA